MTRALVVQKLRRLSGGVPFIDYIPGITGTFNDSGVLENDPALGLDAPYIWVRLAGDRQATAIINLSVSNVLAGMPVMTAIRRTTKEREVIGPDPERAAKVLGGAAPYFSAPIPAIQVLSQPVNTVYAGPASGASAAPTFRALTTADLPAGTDEEWEVTMTADRTLTSNRQKVIAELTIPTGFTLTVESGAILRVVA